MHTIIWSHKHFWYTFVNTLLPPHAGNGIMCLWIEIICGVPRGSILGLLNIYLFLLTEDSDIANSEDNFPFACKVDFELIITT